MKTEVSEGNEGLREFLYSTDSEMYHDFGECLTAREAALAFFKDNLRDDVVWIGEPEAVSAPEGYIDADLLIEHVQCQEEYSLECAEDWPGETKEQRDQLTERLQKVFAEWLDEHGLHPRFSLVRETVKFTREDFPDLPLPFSPVTEG